MSTSETDQTERRAIKEAIKKLHGFKRLKWELHYRVSSLKYNFFWGKDSKRFHLFSSRKFDKVPYIIRRQHYQVGLFSYFITILGGIAFADKNNLLPVVDMKNYPNSYLYDHEVKHVNSWSYYFEQPGGVSLEDALTCKEYILGRDTVLHHMPPLKAKLFYNHDGELDYWREICRKYIKLKPAVLDRLEMEHAKFNGKRVLGVLIRGTDYVTLKPRMHPVQPAPEQVIAKCQEAIQTGGFDAVYLATEDKNIAAKFQAVFGDLLILPECDYIDFDYNAYRGINTYFTDRENDKYLRGLEYLVAILLLTKCRGFITSITCGSVGTMCLSKGFDYLYVFDLGIYH